jgi:hypothetical protein
MKPVQRDCLCKTYSAQQKGTSSHNKLRKKQAMNDLTLPRMRLYQPHNAYNIYFMLERQRLIQEMKELCGTKAVQHHEQISYDLTGYDFLSLPDFPPRFQNIQMPSGWFVPGKNSKRKHVRTHGCELLIMMPLLLVPCQMNMTF